MADIYDPKKASNLKEIMSFNNVVDGAIEKSSKLGEADAESRLLLPYIQLMDAWLWNRLVEYIETAESSVYDEWLSDAADDAFPHLDAIKAHDYSMGKN